MATPVAQLNYCENATLIQSFLTWLERQRIARESRRAYVSDVLRFIRHIEPTIDLHDPAALEQLGSVRVALYGSHLMEKGLKDKTVKRNLMAIRKFYEFLISQKLVFDNPVSWGSPQIYSHDCIQTQRLIEIFIYLRNHQASQDEQSHLRYLRDELVMVCLVLFGIRISQLSKLKTSDIELVGNSVILRISTTRVIDLHVAFLVRLREYLNQRESRADVLFLEQGSRKPISSKSIHALMIELNLSLHVACTPSSLHHTYQHLHCSAEEIRDVWSFLITSPNTTAMSAKPGEGPTNSACLSRTVRLHDRAASADKNLSMCGCEPHPQLNLGQGHYGLD
jgi:site-specific recombinase XerD